MIEDRMMRKVFTVIPEGKRADGRLKTRWTVTACNMFMAALCTNQRRSGARDCLQQIKDHESFLVTSVLRYILKAFITSFCFCSSPTKLTNDKSQDKLTDIIQNIWITENIPQDWATALIHTTKVIKLI